MKLFELNNKIAANDMNDEMDDAQNGMDQNNNKPDDPNLKQNPKKDDEDINPNKNIDSYLFSQVKSLPYATEYDWDDGNKVSPSNIMKMDCAELTKLRTLIRSKIVNKSINDQYGLWADPTMKFYQDMINFVENVIDVVKKKEKSQDSNKE